MLSSSRISGLCALLWLVTGNGCYGEIAGQEGEDAGSSILAEQTDGGVGVTVGGDGALQVGGAAFSIWKTQASAADVKLNSGVRISTVVRDLTEDKLANGEIWIDAISPQGKTQTVKATGVHLELGTETMVALQVGPLAEVGDWQVVVTLHDAAGAELSAGPANRLKITVRDPMAELVPILRGAARFSYCGACQDAGCMIGQGCGSCWAMSDYLCNEFAKAKIRSQVIQYRTAYSSRHRSVQYWDNGWKDVPYRANGIDMMFNATASKPGLFVQRTCY